MAARGYKPMTVADIVERAHVSRRTFYEMFDNRDDCFAAGFELAMEIVETKLDSAIENAENLRLREVLFPSLREYLTFLASEPAVARRTCPNSPRCCTRRPWPCSVDPNIPPETDRSLPDLPVMRYMHERQVYCSLIR